MTHVLVVFPTVTFKGRAALRCEYITTCVDIGGGKSVTQLTEFDYQPFTRSNSQLTNV